MGGFGLPYGTVAVSGVSAALPGVNDGLVLYMDAGNTDSFTEGGSTVNNIAPNKLSSLVGTLINNTVYNADGGGSFEFDGTDDRVDCDTFTNLVGAGSLANYSISIWVKGASGATPGYDVAVGSKTTNFHLGGYSILWHGGAGYMADGTWGASTRRYPMTGIVGVEDDAWNHITMTYDGSNAYIYHAGLYDNIYPTAETADMPL